MALSHFTNRAWGQLGTAGESCAPNFNGPGWASSLNSQARSVFKYSSGCTRDCTGMLINQNGSSNPKQYFVTSRHCFDTQNFRLFAGKLELCGTTNIQFTFNFQSPDGSNNSVPTVATSPYPNSGENRNFANYRYAFISEVRILYYYSSLDVVLGEILTPIPPHFNPYFSGWNPTLTNAANFNSPFVNIHHPRGDVKKASLAPGIAINGNPINTACRVVTKIVDGFLRIFGRRYVTEKICNIVDTPFLVVPYFSHGSVAGGSSGSPLFNSLNKLTGLLSSTAPNASDDCINLQLYYSKFRNTYASEDVRVALNPLGDYLVDYFGINGRSITCYPDLTGNNSLSGRYHPAIEYQPFDNRITISSASAIQLSGADKNGDGIFRINLADERSPDYEGLHIFNNADFVFNANQNITFGPGFVADAGATFEARISPCNLPARQVSEGFQRLPPTVEYTKPDPLTAYPNPTSDEVTFRYILPQAGQVTLTVADLTGRVVATAVDENYEYKGSYERTFSTAKLPSGVYLYTLRVGSFQQTKRFVVVR